MTKNAIVKSSQEQAVAAWIGYLRVLRMEALLDKLSAQDCNLEMAIKALNEVKAFISDPSHILGSPLTKHGEVAEHMQVGIANAEAAIQGQAPLHSFEGVGRLAMEDYLRDGKMIQSKFYNGLKGTFKAVQDHLNAYPAFISAGGTYDIPRDQYAQLMNIYERGENARSSLVRSEETLFKAMKAWEADNSIQIKDIIKPAVVGYDDVQLAVADKTIIHEEKHIKEIDQGIRGEARDAAKPTLAEGAKATAVAAILAGSITVGIKILQKRKAGIKLQAFTEDDWKEVGLDTLIGTGKGAVRGISVYAMANYTQVPTPLASAMVTATFGVTAQARKLHNGNITPEDFIDNCEIICLDVAVSALSSMLGEVLIPIPIFGTIVGNAVGMFMFEISKTYLSATEQRLISKYQKDYNKFIELLETDYQEFVKKLNEEVSRFTTMLALVFDGTENQGFEASVVLAKSIGTSEEKIIKTRAERDAFFIVE